jgi:hypothetical protein
LRLFEALLQVGEHCKVLIYNDHQLVAYFENPRVRGSIPRLATRIPTTTPIRVIGVVAPGAAFGTSYRKGMLSYAKICNEAVSHCVL